MLEMIKNAFRVKEIRNKILFTLFMLLVIRIGSNIPVPGVNTSFFKDIFDRFKDNDALGWMSSMTGGSLKDTTIISTMADIADNVDKINVNEIQ